MIRDNIMLGDVYKLNVSMSMSISMFVPKSGQKSEMCVLQFCKLWRRNYMYQYDFEREEGRRQPSKIMHQ
jgi:hypothetical protein